jgi:hypothetical protein
MICNIKYLFTIIIMTAEQPPTEYFNGIQFNPSFYDNVVITQTAGDARYLEKQVIQLRDP